MLRDKETWKSSVNYVGNKKMYLLYIDVSFSIVCITNIIFSIIRNMLFISIILFLVSDVADIIVRI